MMDPQSTAIQIRIVLGNVCGKYLTGGDGREQPRQKTSRLDLGEGTDH